MHAFETMELPSEPTVLAPDGAEVRVLLSLSGGSCAQFRLAPGQVSRAVTHRTVEEIWYVTAGRGQMWRRQGEREDIAELGPGICLSIPLGTHFQFKAAMDSPLEAIAITMPPWPGEDEAVFVTGSWAPTTE